MPLPKIKISF